MAIEDRIKAYIGQAVFNQLVLSEQLAEMQEKVRALEEIANKALKKPVKAEKKQP